MANSSHYINIYDCTGIFVATYNSFIRLEYGRQMNDIGACTIEFPGTLVNLNDFGEDYIIEIFRYNESTGQNTLVGDTIWILQKLDYIVDDNCSETLEVLFYDTVSILKRRYNLWYLYTFDQFVTFDYPSHLDRNANDSIIQLYNHNFGNNTAATIASMDATPPPPIVTAVGGIGAANRTIDIIAPNVAPIVSDTTVINYECAWKECLAAMQEIANISGNSGVDLWFDIVYSPGNNNTLGSFTFQTWEKLRGNYNTDIIFGDQFGNFQNLRYTLDFTEKKDIIIVKGDELIDVDPNIEESTLGLVYESNAFSCVFKGRELVVEQRTTSDSLNGFDDNALSFLARSELNAHKAIRKVTGELISLPGSSFFNDFNYGDAVQVQFKNNSFLAIINKFSVVVDDSGERITVPIESTNVII